MIDDTTALEFTEELRLLSHLYKEVKKIVLLAETINKESAVLLTAVNELRNAFDHIMRCYLDESDYKRHIDKAKGHLYRAGFDAYELMAIDIFMQIKELLKDRNASAVAVLFPKYYEELLPKMYSLEKDLMDARSSKKPDSTNNHNLENIDKLLEEEFKHYADIVSELMKIQNEVTKKLPSIIKIEDSLKNKYFIKQDKVKNYAVAAFGILAIVASLISLIGAY